MFPEEKSQWNELYINSTKEKYIDIIKQVAIVYRNLDKEMPSIIKSHF